MRRILVTNDDGIHSDGIHALADALRAMGEVIVVAPLTEASAIGHALTLRRPLRIESFGNDAYAVDGTPTDCVNLAIRVILDGQKPDFVASGINRGYNVGDDVTYSGTVAGALEAALLGIPSVAVSLGEWTPGADFGYAARAGAAAVEALLAQPLPPRTFLNVNVPPGLPVGPASDDAGAPQSRDIGDGARRSAWAQLLLDRRGPVRVARRLRAPTTWPCAKAMCR